MKALILNYGFDASMGDFTSEHLKCMTEIPLNETILSRQLRLLAGAGIEDVVIATENDDSVLVKYCNSLELSLHITFVNNLLCNQKSKIYSIYSAKELLDDDIIIIQGDLVFENKVLDRLMASEVSCMTVSSTLPLFDKDYKAFVAGGRVIQVGVDIFKDAISARIMYKLLKKDLNTWLNKIIELFENDKWEINEDNALNILNSDTNIAALDVGNLLCSEISNQEDLVVVSTKLQHMELKTVYMCFSTDIIHSGHLAILNKAAALGKLTVGLLSDNAIASFKRYPMLPYAERKKLFESLKGVDQVICQQSMSYRDVIERLHPDIIVHGDDWKQGFQKPIRDEAAELLSAYGGRLVEFPYTNDPELKAIENRYRAEAALPDVRRGRLKKMLRLKGLVTAIEAHSGITGLIAEKTKVLQDGKTYQFDAMWLSSLCDSTAKGKPDIELVDMTSRFRTIDDIMEVTTKPIIFDGDTGGLTEHFVYTVRTLERMGVSMIIIEDKTGLKKNSLFGNEVQQTQDSIENFSAKIAAGKKAQKTKDFMICARIESLILERGMEEAITRAFAFVKAGADAIMIHSRKKDPGEIKEFIEKFREKDKTTPVVLVPTSFNTVYEKEWKELGANIIIYANQLTRTGFPAMQAAAKTILENHRAKECDDKCMSIKDIITLIPEET